MIKKIITLLSIIVMALSPIALSKETVYKARITYYDSETCKWGDAVACPNTKKAVKGVTVAAHPNFKFGTVVKIPALKKAIGSDTFKVQDRGPAVTKKVASKGKAYVFDIYVKSRSKVKQLAKTMPMYMDVIVVKP
jgi:hypothetical protein